MLTKIDLNISVTGISADITPGDNFPKTTGDALNIGRATASPLLDTLTFLSSSGSDPVKYLAFRVNDSVFPDLASFVSFQISEAKYLMIIYPVRICEYGSAPVVPGNQTGEKQLSDQLCSAVALLESEGFVSDVQYSRQ